MANQIKELGYTIRKIESHDITTDESNVDIDGQTVYLHNVGSGKIYMDESTGVDDSKWEILVGEKSGPWSATKLYFKGETASTLKIVFLGNI